MKKRRISITAASLALAALLIIPACKSVERASQAGAGGARQAALLPLDDQHADEFRRVFDEARDRPRYIVALSPT